MLTDYKIKRITRFPDGRAVVVWQVFEGDLPVTPQWDTTTGQSAQVFEYQRRAVGPPRILQLMGEPSEETIIFELNRCLALDTTRTPIVGQTID